MRYRSRTGAYVNIPDGIDENLARQIKADADNGYVNRALKTAKKAKKKLGLGKVVNKDGTIKAGKGDNYLQQQEDKDVETNFNLATPGQQTDQWGNQQTVTRNPDGSVSINQEAGGAASAFRDAATGAINNFNGGVSRENAQNAAYNFLSRNFDRDRSREMEEAKQEMANRGIPYNPAEVYNKNTGNLYGRTLGAINERYDNLRSEAGNQAILAGNSAFATDASARDSFINSAVNASGAYSGNFSPYQATQTDRSGISQDVMNLSASQFLAKYGIDKDHAAKMAQIQASKEIAGMQMKGSGGGSGGFGMV